MKRFDVPVATELARQLADAFEADGIEYAIGGAIAYSAHSTPRATRDVDINLFVEIDALPIILKILDRLGAVYDPDTVAQQVRERGDFSVKLRGMRVDFFMLAIDLSRSAAKRTVVAEIEGRPARFLSAEDILLFKLLFFRPKDQWDLEKLIEFRYADLDRDYIRRWLIDMVGENDARTKFFDSAVQVATAYWANHKDKTQP